MKFNTLSLATLATTAAGLSNCSSIPTVKTSTGTFKGYIDPEYPNTLQWSGIPFAQPPTGTLRWLPPKALPSSNSTSYAVKHPVSCPQFVSAVETMWNLPLTQGNLIYNGAQNDTSGLAGEATSEDCLYLSVWKPSVPEPEGGFPVLFFMTGGGFVMGGVELPWQIPTPWVERVQEAIIVSVNYRVGIFGFPNARALEDQNLGILDQRLALEWTRDNIAAFGGNPERIMQWGRSAGSISADIHSYAWYEDPIAESYFMESGTAVAYAGTRFDADFTNFTFVAENVGCGDKYGVFDNEGKAELDCMRLVSQIQITNFIGQYQDAGGADLQFGLVPDDKIVFFDWHARSVEGKIARLPALISTTANEFSSLYPWPKDNLTEGPWNPPVQALSARFSCGAYNATNYRNQLPNPEEVPVFRFQYAAEFPNLNVYEWLGAYHNAETSLIFGQYELLNHIAPSTEFQAEVSVSMQDHIMAFAKDPYNGPQELGWEPQVVTDEGMGKILRFGAAGVVSEIVDGFEVDAVCEGLGEYDQFPGRS